MIILWVIFWCTKMLQGYNKGYMAAIHNDVCQISSIKRRAVFSCRRCSAHPLWRKKKGEGFLTNVGDSHIPVSVICPPPPTCPAKHTQALTHSHAGTHTKSHIVWVSITTTRTRPRQHAHTHNVSHSHRHISHTRQNLSQNINSSPSAPRWPWQRQRNTVPEDRRALRLPVRVRGRAAEEEDDPQRHQQQKVEPDR